MCLDVWKKLEAAAARVRGAERVTFREVEACLRDARPALVAAGCKEDAVAAMAGRLFDVLMDQRTLEQSDAAAAASALLLDAFKRLLATAKAKRPVKSLCADCGEDHWSAGRAKRGAAAYLPVSQPALERHVTLKPGNQSRRPFRAGHGLFSCDHHHPALDRAAVRRLVRSLGPDFGPEPPSGGSLSRV